MSKHETSTTTAGEWGLRYPGVVIPFMLESKVNRQILVWTTIIGGFFSSLVKWGSEVNMPPRMPGEISPPGAHIDAWFGWLGFNSHSLDYIYQGSTIPGAVTLYHWLFSFLFAFVYVFVSAYWPKIRLWYGAFYGVIVTVVMHGFLIPLLGFRDPSYAGGATGWLWNLNKYELWSEILGHIYWSVSIEVCMIAVLAHFARPLKGAWVEA
jgi:putative membrane protein